MNGANNVTVSHVYVEAPVGVHIVTGDPPADVIAVLGPLPLSKNVETVVTVPEAFTKC